MEIFWRLILGHFLADFTFQSNFINKWKRETNAGMVAHCLMHPVFYILLTYNYLNDPWIQWNGISINGWLAVALITLVHYLEDAWRVYTIKRFRTPDNTLYLLWDQIIHISVIFIFFGSGQYFDLSLIPEIWPVIGILAIGATHFSVVLVYFIENDLFKTPYPTSGEKYLAIGERFLAFISLAFVDSSIFAWVLAAVALIALRLELKAILQARPLPNIGWALGALMALGFGMVARTLLLALG